MGAGTVQTGPTVSWRVDCWEDKNHHRKKGDSGQTLFRIFALQGGATKTLNKYLDGVPNKHKNITDGNNNTLS